MSASNFEGIGFTKKAARTAVAGAVTSPELAGTITTQALTTAAAAVDVITVTCPSCKASSIVFASLANGTNSAGRPLVGRVTPASGSFTVEIFNAHASAALNGTLLLNYMVGV